MCVCCLVPSEIEELQALEKRNKKKNDHLRHVRTKNFSQKEEWLRAVISEDRQLVSEYYSRLEGLRQTFIQGLYQRVFPMEVLPLSLADEGAEGCTLYQLFS